MSVVATRHGATLLLTMENGAVNALSVANGHVRSILEAFEAGLQDATCSVIV
jgi:hypothetical protein